MLYDLGEDIVQTVGECFFVASNAAVIGRVSLGRDASVWFNAVLRGDGNQITIGDRSNVQDGAVVHVDADAPATLAENVTIGHAATVHGCTIGAGSLIGIGATILSHAVIGRDCIVGAHALVTEGKEFPDRSLIIGTPARRVREVGDEQLAELKRIADHYATLGQRYRRELRQRPGG